MVIKCYNNVIRLSAMTVLLLVSTNTRAQDSSAVLKKNEIGFSMNRYVPDLKTENRPYLFALEYRRYIKSSREFNHFALLRISGSRDQLATVKPHASKLYFGGELGYHARKSNLKSNWFFLWGAKIGFFNIKETITPQLLFIQPNVEPATPFSMSYFKLAFSPAIGVEYEFAEGTSFQFFLSLGFGSHYFGDIAHLKANDSRGFSAQFPSLGLFRKF